MSGLSFREFIPLTCSLNCLHCPKCQSVAPLTRKKVSSSPGRYQCLPLTYSRQSRWRSCSFKVKLGLPSSSVIWQSIPPLSFCSVPLICLSVSTIFFISLTLTIRIFRSLTCFCVSLHFPPHYLTLLRMLFFLLSLYTKGRPSDLLISTPSWHTDSEDVPKCPVGVSLMYIHFKDVSWSGSHSTIVSRVLEP